MTKMPAINEPGANMIEIEACHANLFGCPNQLIDAEQVKQGIEKWIEDEGISERFRERVKGELILHHQKFRISISGCPNGCSRPQIADIGIVGAVRPDVDPAECNYCEGCVDVCPDKAITVDDAPPVFNRKVCQGCTKCREACPNDCIELSDPFYRIIAGGKLGRHPHLGEVVGEARDIAGIISIVKDQIEGFLKGALDEERFADYWIRVNKEGK